MKRTRNILRWIHIAGAGVLGTYIYSPWSSDPTFQLLVQAVVFPGLLGVTGIALWQQGRIKRLLRGRTTPTAGGNGA